MPYYENFQSEIPLFPFLLQGGPVKSMQEQTSAEQIFAARSAAVAWGIPKKWLFLHP